VNTHLHLVPGLRKRGAIPTLPQYVFMALFLVKHSDNFTFTFLQFGITRNISYVGRIPISQTHLSSLATSGNLLPGESLER
jgi:hypothetical protein